MERGALQTTAGRSANHGHRKPRTTVAEHATSTDEANELPTFALADGMAHRYDYLSAHRNPCRWSEPTSGCNQSDCDCRLMRREGAPSQIRGVEPMNGSAKRNELAVPTSQTSLDQPSPQTTGASRLPAGGLTEWRERPHRLEG